MIKIKLKNQKLNEINMSPTFLRQQSQTINAKVGIEFELCCIMPKIGDKFKAIEKIVESFPFFAEYFPEARMEGSRDVHENDVWVAEPDHSIEPDEKNQIGIEFVSPILDLEEAKSSVLSVKKWCEKFGHYTNESTGLHINVSIPEKIKSDPFGEDDFSVSVDFVKLALLLGDKYVLEIFDRAETTFAKSSLGRIHNLTKIDKTNQNALLQAIYEIKNSLQETAMYTLNNRFATDEKYVSIHLHDDRIEFRSPGGNWLANVEKVLATIDRFVVVLDAATDPEKYKKEYIKKLWKLIDQYSRVQSPENVRPKNKDDYKNLYANRLQSDVATKVLKGKQQRADSNAQKVLRSLSRDIEDYERPEPLEENLNDFFLAGDEELFDLEEESSNNLDPYTLASKSPIRILRDKEFYIGHVHRTNLELASALFTSNDEGVFSFDIVVDPKYSKDGLGKDLIKAGLAEFKNLRAEGFVETILLDCVNPVMKKMLEKFGLIVKEEIGENRWIMGLPDSDLT